MKVQNNNLSTTFKIKFSSSHSNFSPNMNTDRSSEELYDEVVIYDGGDVSGYGYPEKED